MPRSRPEWDGPAAEDAAAPGLAGDLARLHATCFPEDPWSAEGLAGLAQQAGCDAMVVRQDGTAAGFAMVRTAADEAELLTICVTPGLRGRGAGRALLHACQDAARARGASRLFLEVAADNKAAIALYTACGFQEAGRRKNYYVKGRANPADARILCNRLPPAPPPETTIG